MMQLAGLVGLQQPGFGRLMAEKAAGGGADARALRAGP